jgi:hypothetical protein
VDPCGIGQARTIHLGNNDSHYVWLRVTPHDAGLPLGVPEAPSKRQRVGGHVCIATPALGAPHLPNQVLLAGDTSSAPSQSQEWGPTTGDWQSPDLVDIARWQGWYNIARSAKGGGRTPLPGCILQLPASECASAAPCKVCKSKYKSFKNSLTRKK